MESPGRLQEEKKPVSEKGETQVRTIQEGVM